MRPSIIALVPARANSKRLAGKNRKRLGGVPLIGWTLQAAKASGCLSHVFVSTEDENIADIAKSFSGEIPWLRSPNLAHDDVRTAEVCIDFLQRLISNHYKIDAVLLLQPTSPFRSAQTIRAAIEIYLEHAGDSVVSVSPATDHPDWCKRIDQQGVLSPYIISATSPRSQDLDPAYRVNGAIYLASSRTLLETGGFYSERTRALVMNDPVESLDIDTYFDWQVAELFATKVASERENVS